jgi:hypothetical protein
MTRAPPVILVRVEFLRKAVHPSLGVGCRVVRVLIVVRLDAVPENVSQDRERHAHCKTAERGFEQLGVGSTPRELLSPGALREGRGFSVTARKPRHLVPLRTPAGFRAAVPPAVADRPT